MPGTAKGRILPRSLSRSTAYAGLSSHAKILYPLLMTNADDQGRLLADPHHLKWEVCPNVEEITPQEIPELLAEMSREQLARAYEAQGKPVIQLLSWWDDQSSMQWAYPSDFIPPEGWDDRLRFRRSGRVITINWPGSTNGSKDVPLSELARQLSFSLSLNVALGKAIGKAIGKLQKEKEQEKEQEEEEGGGTPEDLSQPHVPLPSSSGAPSQATAPAGTFTEALHAVVNAKNRPGRLLEILQERFGSYDWGAQPQRRIAARLGHLFKTYGVEATVRAAWITEAEKPLGDPVSFMQAILRRRGRAPERVEARAHPEDRKAGWPNARDRRDTEGQASG